MCCGRYWGGRDVSNEIEQGRFRFKTFAGILAAVFHQEKDGFAQAGEAFLLGVALAIGFRHFGAKGDESFAVAVDFCGKRNFHDETIARERAGAQAFPMAGVSLP